ncbi:MAG: peptidoglycan DD-metalloendopeptidase family protein [Nostoc sp. RI_552]|nr:peptidoglycan DD-metalloendopeptidase family protein [Nostoc sp. RI_552]
MTQRYKSAHHHSHNLSRRHSYGKLLHIYVSTLPAQSFFLLSSVSFLSSGLAVAQTQTGIDNIVPTVETSRPTAVIPSNVKKDIVSSAPSRPESDLAQRQADLKQRLRSRQQISPPKVNVTLKQPKTEVSPPKVNVTLKQPKTEVSPPKVNVTLKQPKTEVSPPKVNVTLKQPKTEVSPPTEHLTLPEKLPKVARPSSNSHRVTSAEPGKTKDYNNAYIDPINYNTNTTATYQAPSSVLLTERSSGCQTVLPSGQSISGSNCAGVTQKPAPNQPVANSDVKTTPNWIKASQNTQVSKVAPVPPVITTNSKNTWQPKQTASRDISRAAYRPNRFIPNPSNFSTKTAIASPIPGNGGTLPPPMAVGNIAPRPSRVDYNFPLASVLPQIPFTGTLAHSNHRGMIFPLSIPARITSVFGWRTHPITGDRRFHSGTDLGAPMGTPVVASAPGEVETANWLGGYGLTVIINHPSAQQTLYGHLSELFVQPGQRVEQGTVIGRVGSTGNSTGPHLHFEVRHLQPQGWVAVDSGVQLQMALNQLVQALQTPRLAQQPDS